MGVVYEAFDKERGSVVALKALRDLSPERLFRFKREFRSFRDLNHPNLVNLHELHCDRDTWFFTMDLVEGEQLLRWTRPGGALDEGRVRACLEQLAMALLALHDGGKVHRDVKPSNVLVTKEGRVVLLDFGIATENLGRSTDAVLGTIAYIAPEQALGEAASPAADWYAVGVTLFEMLTGRLPINGSPYSMLLGKLNLPHPHPASIASGVPDDLDALCADLLSVRPSERPLGRAILERLQGRPLAPVDRQPFVGRDSELQDLAAEFQANAARFRAVAIIGESGVGKTELTRRFASTLRQAESSCIVLSGTCHQREQVPFQAIDGLIDALASQLKRLPDATVAALLPQHVDLLAHAFPVLGRVPAVAAAPRGTHAV